MRSVDGIIFDVDGTLWDSTNVVERAWNKAIADSGIRNVSVTAADLRSLFGLPMDDIIMAIMPDEPEDVRHRFKPLCFSYEHEFLDRESGDVYPGLENALKALSRHHELFIVSNCQAGYIELFFKKTGYGKYFKDYVCPGDTGLLKADNIKYITQKHGLQAPVYVGDTHMDEEASRQAGVRFVFADYGFGHSIDPDYTIASPEDLISAISSL
ncbi:MAG: HAD family hydrolase [Lachnospiraceae bacterium]|nr:HAD family hydrolase [Lachnospiraceae bacterium]